ncbi:MAG TPA: hypothetical protein VGO53_16670, partial [Steroidobacteraceae bacterium]|nr:hypothetical protein [Steroidobacteraceae bacterium]
MFRYVAFVWNDEEPAARTGAAALAERLRAVSPAWQLTLARKGLEVFCSDVRTGSSEPYELHGGGGVVLGKLFTRGGDDGSIAAPLAIGAPETAKILASEGRRLIDSYWGRYVAFLQDR